MTCKEAYEKFKHLDEILSNTELYSQNANFLEWLAHQFWLVIKEAAENEKE